MKNHHCEKEKKSSWIGVAPELAKAHPLYGIDGWLRFYLAALGVGLFLLFGKLHVMANLEHEVYNPVLGWFVKERPDSEPFLNAGFVALALTVITWWQAGSRWFGFRIGASIYQLATPILVLLVVTRGEPTSNQVADCVIGTLLGSAIWITYLWRSRRVRVTFESKVRSDDPCLAPIVAFAPGSPSRRLLPEVKPTEAMYDQVAQEVEAGNQRKGLWLQCFTEAGGDEKQQLVLYTEARIHELVHEEEGLRRLATVTTEDILCAYPSEAKYREMMSVLSSSPIESGSAQGPKHGT